MSSYAEMSLDDIIQKKRIKTRKPLHRNQLATQKPNIVDARNKIISMKRTQIRDAREILSDLAKQKDARIKLQQMRSGTAKSPIPRVIKNKKLPNLFMNRDRVFSDLTRQVVSQPLQSRSYSEDYRVIRPTAHRPLSNFAPKPIVRTISNDLEIIDDPMTGPEEHRSPKLPNRKASLQLKITAHNNNQRTAITARDKSPPRPPSILKKRSMAALRMDQKEECTNKSAPEYRIIVSNLGNTVSGADIKELFGDVGGMVESRLVRPGTAEVLYKSVEDAQRAVDLYHNRQLDGQPMNCLLVTPRTPGNIIRNNLKPALVSSNSNVEPDISTFHKVLFSNF
ncbi:polymerase delta-interacting protein 3-like isoform X2 [Leptidea sinapis]|uniref:polymerase delta-interacting protein 3-like isoform X2 n=1 Tax=Leptidea sinapis TaxID=189913 RepID=UPI0021C44017|nr:polymerase delta-interacting protein 3-like isoform X2 [Leptidea sinapis]